MKSFFFFFALLLCVLHTDAIITVQENRVGMFPFMVSISKTKVTLDPGQRKTQPEQTKINTHYCGGVLLNARWVLTAAHCWISPNGTVAASRLSVGIGSNDLVEMYDHGRIPATSLTIFPGFDPVTYYHDFALIHLSMPATTSTFACLQTQTTHQMLAIGWGNTVPFTMNNHTGKWGPMRYSRYLKQVDMIERPQACRPDRLCTFGVHPNTGPCRGDSGSPLLAHGAVVGLMGPGAAQPISPTENRYCLGDGRYARISVALDWIRAIAHDVCVRA